MPTCMLGASSLPPVAMVWPFLCSVSIVQEAAGGGAAAEDIFSPGHPQPLPWALQSSELTCPQSRVPTSRRAFHWQIRKSNPNKDTLTRFRNYIKRKIFAAHSALLYSVVAWNAKHCLHAIWMKMPFPLKNRLADCAVDFDLLYVDNWLMCDSSYLFWRMQNLDVINQLY